MPDFATALRETMEERDLRPEHVAIAASLNNQTVLSYLNGTRKPSYDALLALFRAYPSLMTRLNVVAA